MAQLAGSSGTIYVWPNHKAAKIITNAGVVHIAH